MKQTQFCGSRLRSLISLDRAGKGIRKKKKKFFVQPSKFWNKLHKDEVVAIELAADGPKRDKRPTNNLQIYNNINIKKVEGKGHEGICHQDAGLQLTEGPAG